MKLVTTATIEEVETQITVFYDVDSDGVGINDILNTETFDEVSNKLTTSQLDTLLNQCDEHYADFKSKND